MKIALSLIAGVLLLYLVVGIVLYLIQEKFIFFPVKLDQSHSFQGLQKHKEIWLPKSEGAPIHGLHFQAENEKGLVLFFHGNAGALDKWGHAADAYLQLGYSVFIIDYRGYGKSIGKITDAGIKDDVLQAYNWAISNYPPEEIILCGRSLGTGLASWLSAQKPSRALLLETPYTSIADMARRTIPFYPLRYLMRFNFNNVDFVEKSKAPVYVIHGTEDELIPYQMAVQVAQRNGELVTIPGAHHNDLPNFAAYHECLQKIFLAHG